MNDISRPENDDESKRESGHPGGGKGRKDDVGRSGVYPMSGPHPPGQAEIKQQAAWGQGERGAAGYEDHGGSELTYEGGQLLGGLEGGESGGQFGDQDIPHDRWPSFFDTFSRQHLDWLVTIEVASPAGRLIEVSDRRLQGISMDRAGNKERAYIEVGAAPDDHITHTVADPTRVRFKQSPTGEHEGLEITSSDGATTIVRFRTAARPETLNEVA